MLAHTVFFQLNDNSETAQDAMVDACKKYLSGHPGEKFFAAGKRKTDFQRDVNDLDFDISLHLVFENREAHDAYQKAERHFEFIEAQKDNWKNVRVFDTELG